jgi:integrase
MSTTTIAKPLTIQDEQRGTKTVARILLTDPRTGKRVNRRWSERSEAETFVAAVEAFGLEQALTFDDSRRGTSSSAQLKAGSGTRFGTYATEYLERRRKLSEGSQRSYAQRLRVINTTSLGLTPLRDITPDHIEAFIKALAAKRSEFGKPLADRTRRTILDFVRQVLGDAHRRGDIPGDPSQHVEQIKIEDALEPVILTPAEFAAVCAQLAPEDVAFFSFLIQSGCRYGEAMSLKWYELKADANDPTVTLVNILNGKTNSARRTTSIPTALAEQLEPNEGALVFPAVAPDSYRRKWVKAVKAAQLPIKAQEKGQPVLMKSPRVHDLRHTHAVLMLTQEQMNLTALAYRLGHSSPAITATFYAHFAEPQVASLGAVAAKAAASFMV